MTPRGYNAALALASVAATSVAWLVALNLTLGQRRLGRGIERLYSIHEPEFRRTFDALLGSAIVPGNRYRVLTNGDEIFPAMLRAIRSATRSVNFETYIYWSGEVALEFAQALAERASAGVKVHVLLDWFGSKEIDPSCVEQMRRAGVQVQRFHAPSWGNVARFNHRTHRKLLIVDGRIGFTGGVGIAPQWTGNAQDADHWRDTHFQVEGPVVARMQAVFCDNWINSTACVLHGDDYFPALEPVGDADAQMFMSSPAGGSESMQLMYLLAINAAERTIDIANAYFLPDELTKSTLIKALRRGVRLRLIVPGEHIDVAVVRRASRATWGALLRAGAQIHEYQPTMFHCKVMIVDGLLVSVGSTNFDNRSFRLHDEANLNLYDRGCAAELTAQFERDLQRSRRITYADWRARPVHEKVVELSAAVLKPQL